MKAIEAALVASPALEHLNQYISILRGIEENERAEELINKYIEIAKQKNSNYFKLDDVSLHFSGQLDGGLKDKVEAQYDQLKKTEFKGTLEEIDRHQILRDIANALRTG